MSVMLKKSLLLAIAGFSSLATALEIGLDGSFTSSTQVDDWGASSHIQVLGSNGLGMDVGYQYLNSITYNALNTTLTHSMSQYEISGVWQAGNKAFRLQGLAGATLSNSWVQSAGNDVITQYSPGYQVGLGVSVPVFTRLRAFGEVGYQGWLNAEIPSHFKWRYGIRLIFGGNSVQKLEAQEAAEAQAQEAQQQALLDNPPVTIDPNVPAYVPGHLSQSLPPIVANAEICKCFPAGPYTLQLGEFSNMSGAIRGLEYRGLRQFFNSRAYLKTPLPVFLAQAEPAGPVGVYIGELASIDQMQYWRHELRKSGLQARFRKIVGSDGERVANPIVEMDDSQLALAPRYTEEEIRRMNSLPEDQMQTAMPVVTEDTDILMAEKEAYDSEMEAQREQMNQAPFAEQGEMIDTVLHLGPVPLADLMTILSSDAMKRVLSRDAGISVPKDMMMVWNESTREAWLNLSGFQSVQQADEWDAWFQSEGLQPERSAEKYMPMGDVYEFSLGQPLQKYSVEIDRQESIQMMLQSMRSPEVLWFQAYQRINQEPVVTTLNWSRTDNRYHLIVTNVASAQQQQQIWSNLTAVGLLPSLAEE